MRLTSPDMEAGKDEFEKMILNLGDGGLARHAMTCEGDINLE